MYNLFNNKSSNSTASYVYPLFDYVSKVLLRDIHKLVSHRRQNPKSIRSEHILVRTLQSLNILYTGNIEIYRGLIESRTNQISGGIGYSSNFQRGKIFYGRNAQFYGNKTVEIIIASTDDFDLTDADINWPDWQPVRVLAHPRSDINIETLDGTNKFSESGMVVIEVNIPMLACQYQLWKLTQRYKEVKLDVGHFITAYPLTNAVLSHIDISIFNRLSRKLFGEPYGEASRAVPFYTTDTSVLMERSFNDILHRLLKNSLTWVDILKNIPSIQKKNMLEVHQLPKMPMSNQVQWAMVGARLNVVSFLVKLRDRSKRYTSVDEVVALRRSLIDFESGKVLSNGLPSTVVEYFDKFIQNRITHFL
jgi:hypothetical protein